MIAFKLSKSFFYDKSDLKLDAVEISEEDFEFKKLIKEISIKNGISSEIQWKTKIECWQYLTDYLNTNSLIMSKKDFEQHTSIMIKFKEDYPEAII